MKSSKKHQTMKLPASERRFRHGFTLVEVLAVLAAFVIMIAATAPLMKGMKAGQLVTNGVYSISGVIDEARIYAKANNTYTWVGFYEEDGNLTPGLNAAVPAGKGRITAVAVASLDGTKDALSDATKLVAITKLVRAESLSIASTTTLAAPDWPETDPRNQLSAFATAGNYFFYPLAGTRVYTFSKVLRFNPLGELAAPVGGLQDGGMVTWATVPLVAIGLEQIRGNDAASGDKNNAAAVFVEGLTGRAMIYRK